MGLLRNRHHSGVLRRFFLDHGALMDTGFIFGCLFGALGILAVPALLIILCLVGAQADKKNGGDYGD